MKLAQLKLSFTNYPSAIRFFKVVLNQTPTFESEEKTIFPTDNLELVFYPDMGEGDTMAVLTFDCENADHTYAQAIENGARPKSAPSVVENSIVGTVFGPGKILIEFKQNLLKKID